MLHSQKRMNLASNLQSTESYSIRITDENLLDAIRKVPRHLFFHNWNVFLEDAIYQDIALPIGDGRTISRPYLTALMIQLLEIKPGEKVLEMGTGIGYSTALLSSIGARTYTVEKNEEFYKKTQETLASSGFKNFRCFLSHAGDGLPHFAPYNKILIHKSVGKVSEELLAQLTPGGIMVVPINNESRCELIRVTKNNEATITTEIISNEFVFGAI